MTFFTSRRTLEKFQEIVISRVSGAEGEGEVCPIVRSLSAKYRPDRYRRDKSVKFGTELP